MRGYLLAALLTLSPALALAQSVRPDGSIDMSAPSLDVGGNIMQGESNAAAPAGIADPYGTSSQPPLDVQRYAETHASGSGEAGSLAVGDSIPGGVRVHTVPGYPQWGYANVGGENVIVDRESGTVGDIVH